MIGINVGTYVQSKVLMQEGKVMKRLKADPVANTAVASAAFAGKLDAFLQAAVLSSPAQVRELQTLLKGRQLFDGKVDGNYGADLRSAIETYEKAEGLQVTGLATLAILKRLGGGIGSRPRSGRKAPRTGRGRSAASSAPHSSSAVTHVQDRGFFRRSSRRCCSAGESGSAFAPAAACRPARAGEAEEVRRQCRPAAGAAPATAGPCAA